MNQLSIFESFLSKIGQGPKSNTWEETDITTNEPDERILRNTYINGMTNPKIHEVILHSNKRQNNSLGNSFISIINIQKN